MFLFAFSCKQGENKNNNINEIEDEVVSRKKQENDNRFKVILNVKMIENNRIDLFYIGDNPESGFNDQELVSKNILGDDEFQVVELELPKDILPYEIRIDLGENSKKVETIVEINYIKLIFNKNVIEINSQTLDVFFQPNIYLEKVSNGVYLRQVVDGKFDPFLMSKAILNKKIEIEL
jgi:hypothetical protein